MSEERKVKIVSAIFILILFVVFFKIAQYFGYDTEPDRTKGFQYRQEKQKQLQSDQEINRIVKEVIK